eukprot:CAMPEP_0204351604 /NCGR_PEP_ID=MMETSP0469-20131031/31252_1 /ASSEMBLY_ACC=CAM_ASM_000384 /TAXON_ID=2969 /ORGANISM="Oxyrrhis marina" /LENGTH=96 /DNA_ID=CAMNT_0051338191 /DNA_START=241 /DNA_END=527 /DNA_ORIENTATION=+
MSKKPGLLTSAAERTGCGLLALWPEGVCAWPAWDPPGDRSGSSIATRLLLAIPSEELVALFALRGGRCGCSTMVQNSFSICFSIAASCLTGSMTAG